MFCCCFCRCCVVVFVAVVLLLFSLCTTTRFFSSKGALKHRCGVFSIGGRGSILSSGLQAPAIVTHSTEKVGGFLGVFGWGLMGGWCPRGGLFGTFGGLVVLSGWVFLFFFVLFHHLTTHLQPFPALPTNFCRDFFLLTQNTQPMSSKQTNLQKTTS